MRLKKKYGYDSNDLYDARDDFFMGFKLASGVVLYWVISNAFQVFQLLLLNNPFKIIAERDRQAAEAKERRLRERRARKKALKQRK